MADLTVWPNSEALKNALRRRHPADRQDSYVGQWTCLSEWCRIDLVALDAWAGARVVGYEVKVSRADLRTELLHPAKRMEQVARCTEFYIAVPEGLLRPDELAFEEPEWAFDDFAREPCPGVPEVKDPNDHSGRRVLWGGRCSNPRVKSHGGRRRSRYVPKDAPKGYLVKMPVPVVLTPGMTGGTYVGDVCVPGRYAVESALDVYGYRHVTCPTCLGSGYSRPSLVEREWPTLWVPRDVGLIEVDHRGRTEVVKPAARRKHPIRSIAGFDLSDDPIINDRQRQGVADIVRWASNRPDPRHAR